MIYDSLFNNILGIKNYPQPAVYQIRQYKHENQIYHNLEYKYDKFDTPSKIYGDIMTNVVKIWNQYALTSKTTGCIMVGNSGSGKSLMGYILSNIAIVNQIPVVLCTELEFKIETINFLSNLTDCIIFLDEFKKNVPWSLESQMLTMLADPKNTRKLFIITENDSSSISSYILNRPERARYYFEFNKITPSVFKDYCDNFNISPKFYKELEEKYTSAVIFSFDHLQTIVSEHLHYPNDDLNILLNSLNIPILRKPLYVVIEKVIDIATGKELPFSRDSEDMTYQEYKANNYRFIYLQVWENEEKKRNKEEVLFSIDLKFSKLEQCGDSTSFVYNLTHKENKKYQVVIKIK